MCGRFIGALFSCPNVPMFLNRSIPGNGRAVFLAPQDISPRIRSIEQDCPKWPSSPPFLPHNPAHRFPFDSFVTLSIPLSSVHALMHSFTITPALHTHRQIYTPRCFKTNSKFKIPSTSLLAEAMLRLLISPAASLSFSNY
jgi:hypothetical protein